MAQENAVVDAYVNLVELALELGAAVNAVLVLGGFVREQLREHFFLKAHLGLGGGLYGTAFARDGLGGGNLAVVVHFESVFHWLVHGAAA